MVTWQDEVDYLRCNKSFFNQPRFDYVIVVTESETFISQLLCLFKLQVETYSYSLALVRVFGQPPGRMRRRDKDLGLHRVRIKASPYRVIMVKSIVRGTLLVQDPNTPDEYFIVDTLDGDMFLRVPTLSL